MAEIFLHYQLCFLPSNLIRIIMYNKTSLVIIPSIWLYVNVSPFFPTYIQFVWQLHKVSNSVILVQLIILLLTHSTVQSPSWEANCFAASQEIPRISRNPKVHYRTHKRPPPLSILGQHNPIILLLAFPLFVYNHLFKNSSLHLVFKLSPCSKCNLFLFG